MKYAEIGCVFVRILNPFLWTAADASLMIDETKEKHYALMHDVSCVYAVGCMCLCLRGAQSFTCSVYLGERLENHFFNVSPETIYFV